MKLHMQRGKRLLKGTECFKISVIFSGNDLLLFPLSKQGSKLTNLWKIVPTFKGTQNFYHLPWYMALWACFYCTILFQDKLSFCFIPQEKIKVTSICIQLTLFCLSVVFLEFFSMSCSVYFKIMEAEFVRTSLCHCLWKKVASWIFFLCFYQ